MIHILDKSFTLINKTNVAVRQNRQAIECLRNATDSLQSFVQEIHTKLLSLEPMLIFNQFENELHHLFHLVNAALQQSRWELHALRNVIQEAN